MNGNELPSICENASPTPVSVVPGEWKIETGDLLLKYGYKSDEEVNILPQGKCTQANLPDGCPFVSACTGKVRFDAGFENYRVIFLTVSNSAAKKALRQYTE